MIVTVHAAIFFVIAWVDWRRRVIWHALTVPAIVGALVWGERLPAEGWRGGLVGIVVCGVFLFGVWLFSRWRFGAGRFGFGDVMLGALIGAVFGVIEGLWVIALGMVLAGGYATILLWGGAERGRVFGYGAFLAIVAAIGLIL